MSSAEKRIVISEADMVAHVASNLRQADIEEAWAFYGRCPKVLVLESFEKSHLCWTGLLDGEPVITFGCATFDLFESNGVPWLVGTSKLEQVPFTFARMSRPFLRLMKARHVRLTNYVDTRNTLAIRWLRWLGFTLDPAAPAGPFGLPFHHFWMEA